MKFDFEPAPIRGLKTLEVVLLYFHYYCSEMTTAVSFTVTSESGETLRTVDLPAISTADLTAELQTSTTAAGAAFEVSGE